MEGLTRETTGDGQEDARGQRQEQMWNAMKKRERNIWGGTDYYGVELNYRIMVTFPVYKRLNGRLVRRAKVLF